jgi:micrococcal nuclease
MRILRTVKLIVVLVLSLTAAVAAQQGARQTYRVSRVVDGDTIILDTIGPVRLIGVDTPETVDPRRPVQRFGKEASAFTKRLLTGKDVRVEYDWNRKDGYNRTLAYIYLVDGTFVNAELIRQGYGFAYTKYPFKYAAKFRTLERQAREKGVGLWAPDTLKPRNK